MKFNLKGVLNFCKLEIFFKCQTRLSNSLCCKDPIPKGLMSGVVYNFQCGLRQKKTPTTINNSALLMKLKLVCT